MTSCVETYRLAMWRAESNGRITIEEDDFVRYEADIVEISERDARLRLYLRSEQVDLTVMVAETPFVCPDRPRGT